MSYWRRSPCSQLVKYRKRSSIETSRSVIRPGTPPASRQPSSSTFSTASARPAARDPLFGRERSVVALEVPHRARQGGADEALVGVGIVQPAHLERYQAALA